ncbi:MAG: response regulator, partial [Ignavibacteriaceae bacterium]
GDEAIKLVEENGFDVIVLDVQMPGKNGVETLKEIKNIEQLSQVIMLTGHATVKTAIQGMKNGAFDYLMKPTDTDELIEMINKANQLVAEQRDKIRQAEINNILNKRGW